MAPTPPPQPVIGKSGNLTVFITPAAPPSPGPEAPGFEFSTPPTSPRAAESPSSPTPQYPASPTLQQPAAPPAQVRIASPLLPTDRVSTPPLVKTVSPPLPATKLLCPPPVQMPLPAAKLSRPPPVQVPPPQYEKAMAGPDGSVLAFFWDAVARVQEAHASLDEYISNWFGLDQSKYQWALNDYYERTGQHMDSDNRQSEGARL